MRNLSLDGLKLVAESRNIRDCENKSKKDLIKVLSEPKPKIGISKKKSEEIRKDFNELKYKFSKKEIDQYRKSFCDIKNYRYLSAPEIEEAIENLVELKKVLSLKSFMVMLIMIMMILIIMIIIMMMLMMMMNTEKLEALEDYLGFDRDYYKPIRTDDTFDGERNNYLEYKSRGDRYENLSPKKYLKMIRPYLKDLINDHIPVMELDHEKDDSDTERGEWKVQLVMQNSCISTKDFEDIFLLYIQQVNQ